MNQVYVGAVIAAGGMAQRMQGVNKQILKINGIPVLVRSIRALAAIPEIREMVVVARLELFEQLEGWKQEYHLPDFCLTAGGDTRQQSVLNGVGCLSEQVEYVVIHDGARPFADRQLIDRCLQSAVEHQAATAAVLVKDTIKQAADDGSIAATPDRSRLYLTQTPQIFHAQLYRRAAEQAQAEGLDFTDDCQLMEHLGHRVWLAQGDYRNIKITTPEDIVIAQAIAESMEGEAPRMEQEKQRMPLMRIGHGYDVHRLVEGRKLILGGVEIPWQKGLLGHSDADVLVHAVMDAILGAAALGDIGKHFPDTDPNYAGADSMLLLREVVRLVEEQGYQIGNLDCTVIAQQPKLKDLIPQMQERIAAVCKVQPNQVNVKATTEEKLGFTGTGEGMSAHCVCLLTR